MARLRYMRNARTGDAGTVCIGDFNVTGDITVDGSITYDTINVPLSQTLGGYLTVGEEGSDGGFNVIFWGDLSDKYWKWLEESNTMAVKGAFTITGNSTLSGDLNVTGTTTLAVTNIVGAVGINGDVLMDVAHKIGFRTTSIYINSADAGHLDLVANTAIDITATDIVLTGIVALTGATTVTGALTVSGTATFNGLVECESRLGVGGTGNATTLLAGTPTFEVWTTCGTTNTTTAVPSYFNAVMTYATGRGRAIEAVLTTNVALGDWSNAIKGKIDFSSNGSVTGLGSAICAEMVMGTSGMAAAGTYGVLELELNCPSSWTGVQSLSFIYAGVYGDGTAVGVFEETGNLINITGLTDSTGNLYFENTLRINVIGTAKYIPLSTTQGTYTTIYPIVSTYSAGNAISVTVTASTNDAYTGITVNNTCAKTNGGVHKGISSTVTYIPADTGYTTPIGVVGKVTLEGSDSFTGGTGAMYGVQGQLDFGGSSTIDNVSSVFAGLRAVITGAPTCTNFSVVAGLYVDNLASGILTGGQYGSCLAAFTNHGLAIDHAIFIFGANAGNTLTNFLSIQGSPSFFLDSEATGGVGNAMRVLVGSNTYYINLHAAS